MTSYEAAVLSCRILALYVMFHVLSLTSFFPMAMMSAVEQDNFISVMQSSTHLGPPSGPPIYRAADMLFYLLPFLSLTAFAAFLWFKAAWFAKRITVAAKPDAIYSPIRMREVQTGALAIMGVLLLVQAIPEVVNAIATSILATAAPEEVAEGARIGMTAGYWTLIVRFALGLGLIFRAAKISETLDKVQR